MKKIAVVNSSSFGQHFPQHIETLENIENMGKVEFFRFKPDVDSETLVKELSDFDYIISSVTPTFNKEFFENTPKLKAISRHGIGYNNIDIDAADENNVTITIVDAVTEKNAVAETAIALLLALSRQIPKGQQLVKDDRWDQRQTLMGFELSNKTFGVIGFGNIGSRIGEIAYSGFNCNVIAYDPYLAKAEIDKYKKLGIQFVSDLDTLFKQSDFISLNANLTEKNYGMLNAEKFKIMKANALVVNTARGALVNEEDLLKALDNNEFSGYAADVAIIEPMAANHPFLKEEKILITPHLSAYTWKCLRGMGEKCVEDIVELEKGNKPRNIITNRR